MKNKLSILLLCLLTGNLVSMEKEDKTKQEKVSESEENYFNLLPTELKTLVFHYVIGDLKTEDFVKALTEAKKEINNLSTINSEFRDLTKLVESKEKSSYLGNIFRKQVKESGIKSISIGFAKGEMFISFYFNGKPYKIHDISQNDPSIVIGEKCFGDFSILSDFSVNDIKTLVSGIKKEIIRNRNQIKSKDIVNMLNNTYECYKLRKSEKFLSDIENIAKGLDINLKKD